MITELLTEGRDNAKTGRELAEYFGCNIRTITEQIARERHDGQPICAISRGENPGYYLAADPEELQDYCNALKHRATELFRTRQALIKVLKKLQEDNGTDEENK